jgi:hypothetical protein
MPLALAGRQPISRLTAPEALPYDTIAMTNLAALAISSPARLWWRGCIDAARWRD